MDLEAADKLHQAGMGPARARLELPVRQAVDLVHLLAAIAHRQMAHSLVVRHPVSLHRPAGLVPEAASVHPAHRADLVVRRQVTKRHPFRELAQIPLA
jgi:hypothetical protein